MEQKELNFEVTVTIDATMSIVGVFIFFPLIKLIMEKSECLIMTMNNIKSIVSGIALAGRMELCSNAIRHWEQL